MATAAAAVAVSPFLRQQGILDYAGRPAMVPSHSSVAHLRNGIALGKTPARMIWGGLVVGVVSSTGFATVPSRGCSPAFGVAEELAAAEGKTATWGQEVKYRPRPSPNPLIPFTCFPRRPPSPICCTAGMGARNEVDIARDFAPCPLAGDFSCLRRSRNAD